MHIGVGGEPITMQLARSLIGIPLVVRKRATRCAGTFAIIIPPGVPTSSTLVPPAMTVFEDEPPNASAWLSCAFTKLDPAGLRRARLSRGLQHGMHMNEVFQIRAHRNEVYGLRVQQIELLDGRGARARHPHGEQRGSADHHG